MLSYLTTSAPGNAVKLFSDYDVSYVLLTNADFEKLKNSGFATNKVIFKNSSYTLMSFRVNKSELIKNL
jgi:hypothetical protein